MFLLRSAVWLALAFVAIGPKDVDFSSAASELSNHALAAGQQVVMQQISQQNCTTLHCIGGKTLMAVAVGGNTRSDSISTTSNPPGLSPMQDSAMSLAPVPMPRPLRLG